MVKVKVNGIEAEMTDEEFRRLFLSGTGKVEKKKEEKLPFSREEIEKRIVEVDKGRVYSSLEAKREVFGTEEDKCLTCGKIIPNKKKEWRKCGYCTKKCADKRAIVKYWNRGKKERKHKNYKSQEIKERISGRMREVNTLASEIKKNQKLVGRKGWGEALSQAQKMVILKKIPKIEVSGVREKRKSGFGEEHRLWLADRMRWINNRARWIVKSAPHLSWDQAKSQAVNEHKQKFNKKSWRASRTWTVDLEKPELDLLKSLAIGTIKEINLLVYKMVNSKRDFEKFKAIVLTKESQIMEIIGVYSGRFKLNGNNIEYEK